MFTPRSSRPVTVAAFPSKNGGLRRKKKGESSAPTLELERIFGLTTSKPTALSTSPSHDLIAYAAGSVVVLYNHKKNKQVGFLHAPSTTLPTPQPLTQNNSGFPNRHTIAGDGFVNPLSPLGVLDPSAAGVNSAANTKKTAASNKAKPISCLAFSPDGNYLAVGETGHQPRILIWDIQSKTLVNELKGHKYGVLALSFSPNMKYVVSLGFQHDGYLNVWNWKQGIKLACNKVTTKVHTLAFNKTGSCFITAGLRHVKFWYFDTNGNLPKKPAGQSIQKSLVQVLDGRSGILGDLRDNNFVDAIFCKKSDHAYFVTSNGLLCMFTEGRMMDKWVDLQVKSAFSIDVSEQYIICACTNGVVRLFEPVTLKYLGTLPKPHPLGVDLSSQTGLTYHGVGNPNDIYPDTIAVKLDGETGKLTCVHSDRSIFVWDIKDVKKIGKYRSFLYHCDCIWGVEMIPVQGTPIFPENTFVTYSSDGTIRFWNLDGANNAFSPTSIVDEFPLSPAAVGFKKNIYSKECLKIVYVDPDGTFRMSAAEPKPKSTEPSDPNMVSASELGIRTLKISPDGKLIASGDRGGNLRVHDLDTFQEITYQEAHDAEILSIEFSDGRMNGAPYLIATASRDRIIHIFDIDHDFRLIQTLDDHSSAITAVRFTNDGGRLISCGADKSIIFRSRQHSNDIPYYVTYHNISGRSTVFDMDIDISNKYIATVSGERRLNVYHIDTGKNVRSHKSDTPDEINIPEQGSLLKVNLDPGGLLAVSGGSDKSIRMFDFANGTILAKVLGHSELITGVKFTTDCQRIVSTSADGCIFIWRVSDEWVAKMRQKWSDRRGTSGRLSPVMREIVSPQQTSSSQHPPRTSMPAQRPQTIFADLSSSNEDGSPNSSFTVQRLKNKRSIPSLTTADTHHDDAHRRLSAPKRPVSFANDVSSTPAVRLQQQESAGPTTSANDTPTASPKSSGQNSPASSRRESWKIGLPSWAKKAFKEKDDERETEEANRGRDEPDNDAASNGTTITSSTNKSLSPPPIPFSRDSTINLDKKLPAIPRLVPKKTKSQSKLRQDATSAFSDGITIEASESKSDTKTETSPILNDDDGGDEELFSPAEDELAGEDSSYEDTETIFVEPVEDEAIEEGTLPTQFGRRRGSYAASIKKVDITKSSSDNEKDNEMNEEVTEEEEVEAEEIESDGENTKLEMYLQAPLQPTCSDHHQNESEIGCQLTSEQKGKKRESFTSKFFSSGQPGHQKHSSCDSSNRNSLMEALSKIGYDDIEGKDIKLKEDEVGRALESLEGKAMEVTSKEFERDTFIATNSGICNPVEDIASSLSSLPSRLLSESSTFKEVGHDNKQYKEYEPNGTSKSSEPEGFVPLAGKINSLHESAEEIHSDKETNKTIKNDTVTLMDNTKLDLGRESSRGDIFDDIGGENGPAIVVRDDTSLDIKENEGTTSLSAISNIQISSNDQEEVELDGEKVGEDVLSMAVLTERILAAYKQANSALSSSKNESISKLISESLKGIMADIKESLGMNDETKEGDGVRKVPRSIWHEGRDHEFQEEDDEGDADSNASYTTAMNYTQEAQHLNVYPRRTSSSSHNRSISTSSTNDGNSTSPPLTNNLTSQKYAQNLLEHYSDMLVKMVDEKMTMRIPTSTSPNSGGVSNEVSSTSISTTTQTTLNQNANRKTVRATQVRSGSGSSTGGTPAGVGRAKITKTRFG